MTYVKEKFIQGISDRQIQVVLDSLNDLSMCPWKINEEVSTFTFAYFQILDYTSVHIVKDKKFVICFRIPIELSIGAVQINFFMYDHEWKLVRVQP